MLEMISKDATNVLLREELNEEMDVSLDGSPEFRASDAV